MDRYTLCAPPPLVGEDRPPLPASWECTNVHDYKMSTNLQWSVDHQIRSIIFQLILIVFQTIDNCNHKSMLIEWACLHRIEVYYLYLKSGSSQTFVCKFCTHFDWISQNKSYWLQCWAWGGGYPPTGASREGPYEFEPSRVDLLQNQQLLTKWGQKWAKLLKIEQKFDQNRPNYANFWKKLHSLGCLPQVYGSEPQDSRTGQRLLDCQ